MAGDRLRAWSVPSTTIVDLFQDTRKKEFLRFVLDHYVARGVGELATDKLPQLIELKYHSLGDAVRELGPAGQIRQVFVGFQRHLY